MNEIEKISAQIIQRNFDFPETENEVATVQQVRDKLIERINFLLDHDFEKLLWILYRIDVSEQKAKEVLARQSDLPPAEVLADLIIERQIQKAETRLKYQSRPQEKSEDSFSEH